MHTALMKIPCFFFDLYLQGWKQRINLATKYCLFVVVFFIFQHKTFKKLWFIFQIFLFLTSFYSHHTWFCLLYIFFCSFDLCGPKPKNSFFVLPPYSSYIKETIFLLLFISKEGLLLYNLRYQTILLTSFEVS